MSYRICPKCGAYLDPCESCDCQDVGKPQTFVKREKKSRPGVGTPERQGGKGQSPQFRFYPTDQAGELSR